MSAGRWAFGIGGELTWWYVPTIGLIYAWLSLWTARRIRIVGERGRSLGRAPIVMLALAWACAIAFGFMVPDLVNGELVTIVSLWFGPELHDVTVGIAAGICNPLGIIAFACQVAALAFAAAAAREPHVDDDSYDGSMPAHPLA